MWCQIRVRPCFRYVFFCPNHRTKYYSELVMTSWGVTLLCIFVSNFQLCWTKMNGLLQFNRQKRLLYPRKRRDGSFTESTKLDSIIKAFNTLGNTTKPSGASKFRILGRSNKAHACGAGVRDELILCHIWSFPGPGV